MNTSNSAPQPKTRAQYRARAIELTEIANEFFDSEVRERFIPVRKTGYDSAPTRNLDTLAGLAALAQVNLMLSQDPNIPER